LGIWVFRVGLRRAVLIAGMGLMIASPTLLLYIQGSSADRLVHFGFQHVANYGASLNSIFIPNIFHPIYFIRMVSLAIYAGPWDESGVANLGLGIALLGLAGGMWWGRSPRTSSGWIGRLLMLSIVGCGLALGPHLKWNGRVSSLSLGIIRDINRWIWWIGYILKPALFAQPWPEAPYANGIPMPGILMLMGLPFAEGARVMSRYILLGALGLIPLALMAARGAPACFVSS